jgi:hypothetical protein
LLPRADVYKSIDKFLNRAAPIFHKSGLLICYPATDYSCGAGCLMTYTSITRFILILSRTLVRSTSFILIVSFISTSNNLQAAETTPTGNQNPGAPQISILEGKSFSGELGLVGKPASATDLLLFDDGMFISKGCEARCGYTAAEYQIRAKGDHFEVISETPCLKSDATILWQGTVKGDEIEGSFTWINKRWYWTFEKEFWFKGKLIESNAAETEQE